MLRSPALKYTRSSYLPKDIPDSNCVLWLPGQDDAYGALIKDHSGQGNDGTIYGGATWAKTSQGLWYLSLDGSDDYISCGTDTSLNLGTGDGTWIIWFSTENTGANAVIIDKEGTHEYQIRIESGADKARFYIATNGEYRYRDTSTAPNDGNWHQFAATWDGSTDTINLWLDGVSNQGSQTAAGVLANVNPTGALTLGKRGISNDMKFPGYIALARFFNQIIATTEIASSFHQERHLFGV